MPIKNKQHLERNPFRPLEKIRRLSIIGYNKKNKRQEVPNMTILDCDNTVYDNAIEMYFHEYFLNRDIDISGLNYKDVDNSVFEDAMRYIYRRLFKPDKTTVRYNNKNTKIDLKNIDELNDIAECYINLIKGYNITPFDNFFLQMTGIHKDTWNSWKNEEYSHNGLSHLYSDLYKKIHDLPRQQVRNNMSKDKIGIQSLANNDPDVGLEYNSKKQFEAVRARVLTSDELPRLDLVGMNKNAPNMQNIRIDESLTTGEN